MNVSLTPKLEEFVRERIASGLYNNASEVVREALRLLVDKAHSQAARQVAPQKADVCRRLLALETVLREKGIAHLALFGSVLHGDARPDSDVDVLIDTVAGRDFSLIDLVAVKNLLEAALGREVDVVTRQGLEPAIQQAVFREAEVIF
jgi:putative addiction module CopG family antidote